MKRGMIVIFLFAALQGVAQEKPGNNDETETQQKPNLQRFFTGGSLNVGFSGYSTNLGISPIFGYSLTNWMDAGISLNVNYISQRDYQEVGDKLRQTLIGPGAFVRLFPVNFLFASAQYEYNFIRYKYIPSPAGNYVSNKVHVNASSLLLGAGYAGGRQRGGNSYYYFSISWDVLGDRNSPYVDSYGRTVPVIRAGYNIGLFQGRRSRF